jgi:hypothetical protein
MPKQKSLSAPAKTRLSAQGKNGTFLRQVFTSDLSVDQLLQFMVSGQSRKGRLLSTRLCSRIKDLLDEEQQFRGHLLVDIIASCLSLTRDKCQTITDRYNSLSADERASLALPGLSSSLLQQWVM